MPHPRESGFNPTRRSFYSLEQTRSLRSRLIVGTPSSLNAYYYEREGAHTEQLELKQLNKTKSIHRKKQKQKETNKKEREDHILLSACSCANPSSDSPTRERTSSSSSSLTFLGAVIVRTPSEERLEVILNTSCDGGKTYLRTKCLLTNPCSSCLSSCLASTITWFPTVFTVISSGENC